MSARRCPACEATRAEPAFVVAGYPLVRCTACGCTYVDPPPTPSELAAIYGRSDYYDGARAQVDRLRSEARERAHRIESLGARSVLDIGCAAGYFLDAARSAGLSTVGVEPGPAAADAVANGHEVIRTWIGEAGLRGRRFDAVTLWEVVEHVPEPIELLRQALAYLEPHGILAISTPSMSGVPARLLGSRFPMVTPPEHLTLLTRRSAMALLRRAGCRPLSVRSFSNLGADQISSGIQRFVTRGFALPRSAVRALSRPLVGLAALMDRLGLGSELEIYARRA